MIKVLAHDPGSTNAAYAVVHGQVVRGKLRVRVVKSGKLTRMVKQLKEGKVVREQIDGYLDNMREVAKGEAVRFFIAERYMTRGIKGPTVEYVNVMLGALVSRLPYNFKLLPAGQWKNEIGKCELDLKQFYKDCAATPHQIDAVFMGIYALMKLTRTGRMMFTPRMRTAMISAIEKTSEFELRNLRSRMKAKKKAK